MRINKKYANIWFMKTRLNLTIDEQLMDGIKAYAASRHTSVSELVENYFRSIGRPAKRKTVLDILEKLPTPKQTVGQNYKEGYYKAKSGKYGF